MTYNVGAFGKELEDSAPMIARMIGELGAETVSLNELDSCNRRHNIDQAQHLADELNAVAAAANHRQSWKGQFGRAMAYKGGAYGNGVVVPKDAKILSKYTVTLAKGSGSEQRSIAVVETEKYVIGASHLDHKSTEAQIEQVSIVNRWAESKYRDSKKPVFYLGDMNNYPDTETITALKQEWDLLSVTNENSFPSRDAKNCIDYIFHYKKSAPVKVVGSHVMTQFYNGDVTMASDHLPIYVDVQF